MADAFYAQTGSLESRLASALSRLSAAIRAKEWSKASAQGLTPTQGLALGLLRTRGPLRMAELAERLGVSSPTASDCVRALVKKGLVHKAKAPDDGRAIRLELTDDGQAMAAQTAEWPEFLIATLDSLSDVEKRTLLTSVIKMIRTLQIRGDIPPERMCVTCVHFRPRRHSNEDHHCTLVNLPLRATQLRLDCREHNPAPAEVADQTWQAFLTTTT